MSSRHRSAIGPSIVARARRCGVRLAGLLGLGAAAVLWLAPAALAQVSFGGATNFAVGDGPESVAVGDFDRDGRPDVAAANATSNNVSVLLAAAGGSFTGPTNFAAGVTPISVAVGDFDGALPVDLDLAVANIDSDNVSVLRGGPGGSFTGPINSAVHGGPVSVAVADLNGGIPDLVVANAYTEDVAVLRSTGGGTFFDAFRFHFGSAPESVAVGDFNGDHRYDLAVAIFLHSNVTVLLGIPGRIGFTGPFEFGVGFPQSVAVADFNGDRKPDLAVTNGASNSVSVLLGAGDGSFSGPTNYAVGDGPAEVAVGDFDGDSDPDLAVANANSNNVSVLLGAAGGSFIGPDTFAVGGLPVSVGVGDFDGDGKPDLAVANYDSDNVSVLLNTTTNHRPRAADDSYSTGQDTPLDVAAPGVLGNDSDRDGDTLTASLVSGPSHGSLTLNSDGSFTYTPATNYNGQDSFTYKASDGELESDAATVKITAGDILAPAIRLGSPVEAAVYLLGQAVVADYDCADETGGSGVASCTGNVASGDAVATASEGAYTFSVTATDNVGNTRTVTRHYYVLSGSVTQAAGGGGAVTTDPFGAGASPDVPVQTQVLLPAGAPSTTVSIQASAPTESAPNGFDFYPMEIAIDAGGITASVSSPFTIVFTVDFSLVMGAPPNETVVFRNDVVVARCGDATAAVPDPCLVGVGMGSGNDYIITLRTTHFSHWNVGRSAYDFSGFLQPVDNLPTVNAAKAGSAIPVKFSLGADRGLDIFQPGSPAQAVYACDSSPTDTVEQTVTASSSSLRYDAATNTYTYVWKTDKGWAPSCRELTLSFRDGSIKRARFKFTK